MKEQFQPQPGKNEAYGFSTYSGAHPSIQVNSLDRLSKERTIVALQRLRKIVETEPLNGYNDTTIGYKNTECSWGLCSDSKKLWPDAKDHVFPYDFLNYGRVTTLSKGHACPMVVSSSRNGYGCFWNCRFFQRHKSPTQKEMLALIDAKLVEVRGLDERTEE